MLPIRCSASLSSPCACRDALAGPKRLLKGWEVLEPTKRRSTAPAIFSVVQLLAARWAAEGRRDLAIAALLGFECYFRPSELCGVLLSDITWDRSVRNDKIFIGAIALRQTKTGANMEVLLRAITLLREYLAVRTRQPGAPAKGARLFTFTADHFRTQLQRALPSMGLAHLQFTPHCLRHGGATRDRKLGLDMQEIQDRGRWVQLKSCQRYVQIWSSLAIQMKLPDYIAALLLKL
jgi:integrase